MVFNNPLEERLSDNRPGVTQTGEFCHFSNVFRSSYWSNAVDHGVGECDILLNPLTQLSVFELGKSNEHLLSHMTIALDVVTGKNGERGNPTFTPTTQSFGHKTECGGGNCAIEEIGCNGRRGGHKFARYAIKVVSTLGDGQ